MLSVQARCHNTNTMLSDCKLALQISTRNSEYHVINGILKHSSLSSFGT